MLSSFVESNKKLKGESLGAFPFFCHKTYSHDKDKRQFIRSYEGILAVEQDFF
jgi:hypothetical protein